VVVDGRVGEVLGLVPHNNSCIRSTPLHRKEEELPWSDGSPKRVGGRWRNNGMVALWHWGAALRYGGALGPMQGGWEAMR
jgi:hypothetical protein